MILTALGPLAAYRMHMPKGAAMPASGAGAAAHGGRANRLGTHALYLAHEPVTAIREYQRASMLLPPGTLVSYAVKHRRWWTFVAATKLVHGPRFGKNSPATGERFGSIAASSHPVGFLRTRRWLQARRGTCSRPR